jgi:hypothetical protein
MKTVFHPELPILLNVSVGQSQNLSTALNFFPKSTQLQVQLTKHIKYLSNMTTIPLSLTLLWFRVPFH